MRATTGTKRITPTSPERAGPTSSRITPRSLALNLPDHVLRLILSVAVLLGLGWLGLTLLRLWLGGAADDSAAGPLGSEPAVAGFQLDFLAVTHDGERPVLVICLE